MEDSFRHDTCSRTSEEYWYLILEMGKDRENSVRAFQLMIIQIYQFICHTCSYQEQKEIMIDYMG